MSGGLTYAPGAGINFVQANSAQPASPATTAPITYPIAQTAGNLNVVIIGWADATTTVQSVTDSAGNTYNLAFNPTVGTGISQAIYYAKNINAAASNTVTVTFSAPAQGPDVRVLEYSGLDTGNPLDTGAGNAGTGTKGFQDGAADGGTHHWKKRIGESAGILANGFTHRGFDAGSERFAERVAASLLAAKLNGFGDDRADVLGACFRIGNTMMQPLQGFLFGSEDKMAQFLKRACAVGRRVVRLLRNTFCGSVSHRHSAKKFRWAGTRPQGKGSLPFRQLQFVLETQSEFIEEISEHGAIGLVVAECFGFTLEGSFQLLLGRLDLIAECLGLFQDARA